MARKPASSTQKKQNLPKRPFAEALLAYIERPWAASLLLLAWTLVLLLPGVTLFPVNDRDEAKFGRAAIEMAERNNWILPTFDNDFVRKPDKELKLPEYKVKDGEKRLVNLGDYRFDKPIGVYWLMRLSLLAFGEKELVDQEGKPLSDGPFQKAKTSEQTRVNYLPGPRTDAALRLPSILSSWVVALIIFSLGAQLYSARVGLLAAFAWVSCLQVLIHGRLIVADMPMIAAIAAAMWAAWKLLFVDGAKSLMEQISNPDKATQANPKQASFMHWKSHWWWLWTLSLAWGFLVKGPIAWAVPVAALLLMRWLFLRRKIGAWRWRRLAPLSTMLVVLSLVALWALPANLATNWEFTKIGLGYHVVDRSLSSFNSRASVPLVYYLLLAPLSLLPWGGLIPLALSRQNQAEKRDPRRAFLLAWLLAPYLIFSPLSTQLPHYVLPAFPAFFLLLMRGGWPKISTKWQKNWLIGVWLLGLLLATVILVFYFRANWGQNFNTSIGIDFRGRNEQVIGFKRLILSVAGVLIVLSSALALSQLKRPFLPVLACLLLCAFLTHEIAQGLRQSSPTIALHKQWQELEIEQRKRLRSWKYSEPSLVYYAGREWSNGGSEQTVSRWLEKLDDQILVVKYRSWRLDWDTIQALWRGESPAPAEDFDELLRRSRGDIEAISSVPIEGYNPATSSWVKLYLITEFKLSEDQQKMIWEKLRRHGQDLPQEE